MDFTNPKDVDLVNRALRGEPEATKMYCGSYTLIRERDSLHLYRFKGDDIPVGCVRVETFGNKSVYDEDGFLLDKYWSLPRYDND